MFLGVSVDIKRVIDGLKNFEFFLRQKQYLRIFLEKNGKSVYLDIRTKTKTTTKISSNIMNGNFVLI